MNFTLEQYKQYIVSYEALLERASYAFELYVKIVKNGVYPFSTNIDTIPRVCMTTDSIEIYADDIGE